MKYTKEFLVIDGVEHDVTHIMESKFKIDEIVWWLIQIGRWYKAETMMLIDKSYWQSSPIPVCTRMIRRFELKYSEKARV